MRQLQMLHEARCFHAIGVRQHELLVLCGRVRRLAEFVAAKRAVDQRHRHRLALAFAHAQAIATRELRRHAVATVELIDHLALGQGDRADLDGEAKLFRTDQHIDFTHADFTGEGMGFGIATLSGIGHAQQKALVAARKILQSGGAIGRKHQRLAREVGRLGIAAGIDAFDQRFRVQQIQYARHGIGQWLGCLCRGIRCCRFELKQALGVVVGRAEHLAAGDILERARHATVHAHRIGIQRLGVTKAGQRGAIGAQQKNRLEHVTGGLAHRHRGQLLVVQRTFLHDAGNAQAQLLANLIQRQLGCGWIATTRFGEQLQRAGNGLLATFNSNVHSILQNAGRTWQRDHALPSR
jgi:hypothetical protein